jgi:hypothetical protein
MKYAAGPGLEPPNTVGLITRKDTKACMSTRIIRYDRDIFEEVERVKR